MNFLAHIYLSGDDDELVLGNFIGDFVKGNQAKNFPERVQKGIMLHRFIDAYTDNHPVVLESKKRLRPDFRHYSPVIVDVFYDHFLAKLWQHYHHLPLKQFTESFYESIKLKSSVLPDKAKHMLTYMSRDNWLYHYQYVEGINRALGGMSRRTNYDSGMENATKYLKEYYSEFQNEFSAFFPQLVDVVAKESIN